MPGFIGTLAIQQSTRSPREESETAALSQFDFKLKLCAKFCCTQILCHKIRGIATLRLLCGNEGAENQYLAYGPVRAALCSGTGACRCRPWKSWPQSQSCSWSSEAERVSPAKTGVATPRRRVARRETPRIQGKGGQRPRQGRFRRGETPRAIAIRSRADPCVFASLSSTRPIAPAPPDDAARSWLRRMSIGKRQLRNEGPRSVSLGDSLAPTCSSGLRSSGDTGRGDGTGTLQAADPAVNSISSRMCSSAFAGELTRVAGDERKILVTAHQRSVPGISELLEPPFQARPWEGSRRSELSRRAASPLIARMAYQLQGDQRACDAATAEISSSRAACCSQGMLSTLICGRPGLSTRLSSTACPVSTAAERNR